MRVLGIDPGTFKMGVGIVDYIEGDFNLVYSGVLKASRRMPIYKRLHILHEELLAITVKYKPLELAAEQPFVSNNVKTAIAIGQAQSVAMMVSGYLGVDFFNYMPTEVKKAVTDHGLSTKAQVNEMIRLLLKLPDSWTEKEDATDALAVAICHINNLQVSAVLNNAEYI
ncbi:MAG: crossover junction endodeoxyribonuclease RuvC [Chloroflexi bacterium]|nr:crossover junction endodeoxyribonuclease RuvC [Chloroflexota bacterium]